MYVAAAIAEGRRKTAIHATDLALKHWVRSGERRAFLLYVRGQVVRRHMRDPKTALGDLSAAGEQAPAWLQVEVADALRACKREARASRKKKPSVGRSPEFVGPPSGDAPPREDVGGLRHPPPLWADLGPELRG